MLYGDPVLDELVVPEPEGYGEYSVTSEIDRYVRKLRMERERSPRGRNMSEADELRCFFNNMLYPYGFRVSRIPGRVWS